MSGSVIAPVQPSHSVKYRCNCDARKCQQKAVLSLAARAKPSAPSSSMHKGKVILRVFAKHFQEYLALKSRLQTNQAQMSRPSCIATTGYRGLHQGARKFDTARLISVSPRHYTHMRLLIISHSERTANNTPRSQRSAILELNQEPQSLSCAFHLPTLFMCSSK